MTTSVTRPSRTATPTRRGSDLLPRVVGAALSLGVGYIHYKDQGGLPGDKSPTYVGIGYYLLEAAAVLAAVWLLLRVGRHTIGGWTLALGVALGPIVGFILSRGPGLPSYNDDKGNWTEPLGIISLVVEGALLLLAAFMIGRSRSRLT